MTDGVIWWTTNAVEQWEASKRQWEAYCAQKEKEVRDCLKDLTPILRRWQENSE